VKAILALPKRYQTQNGLLNETIKRYRTDFFSQTARLKTVEGDALIPMELLAGAKLLLKFSLLLRGCLGEVAVK
jgi:hypothetical protein